MLGLLGAAMIALKGVKNVIIRRDQYSEVDNATHIHVWETSQRKKHRITTKFK